jgi:hypothetical protein
MAEKVHYQKTSMEQILTILNVSHEVNSHTRVILIAMCNGNAFYANNKYFLRVKALFFSVILALFPFCMK